MWARAKLIVIVAASALVAISSTAPALASEKKSTRVELRAVVPVFVYEASDRAHTFRRVARHGVYYYAPRIVIPEQTQDDWDDAYDDDEDEFDSVDGNHDGFIALREARRSHADWARDFRKIDTSGDGYLTREEIDVFYRR
jgi:hypothetical protein